VELLKGKENAKKIGGGGKGRSGDKGGETRKGMNWLKTKPGDTQSTTRGKR